MLCAFAADPVDAVRHTDGSGSNAGKACSIDLTCGVSSTQKQWYVSPRFRKSATYVLDDSFCFQQL